MKITNLIKVIIVCFSAVAAAFVMLVVSYMHERNAAENYAVFKQLGLDLSAASDFLTEQAQKYVQYGERKYYDAYWDEINNQKNRERVVEELKSRGAPQSELALVERAARLSNTLAELEGRAFEAVEAGNLEAARSLMFGSAYDEGKIPIIETMSEFQNDVNNRTKSSSASAELLANAAIFIFAVLLLSVAAVIIVSLRKIIVKLKEMTIRFDETTSDVQIASNQLSETCSHVAQSSSIQEANIEEISAAMNETAATITKNAESTRFAVQIAAESRKLIDEAGKYVAELMSTMAELKESSNKIQKIVQMTDGIASQTNILALNASVEAVRGGEHGRSFAVVAEEVRNLAQKSTQNSQETADIIDSNIAITESSRAVVEQVLDLTQKQITQIANLENLIFEITSASEEQSNGVQQINKAISEMEEHTQDNAASAQESYVSVGSLSDSADNLADMSKKLLDMI